MDINALFKIHYGLYILTAQDKGIHNGCIINTAMQITSQEPFLMTISINKSNYTTELLLNSGTFNISILSEDATFEQIKQFGFVSGRNVNKFKDLNYSIASNGAAYINDNTSAYLSCDLIDKYDFDTHYIIKALLTDSQVLSKTQPTTYAYYQSNIKPKPQPSSGWVCSICGYKYDGLNLPDDFICPICKHGASDFIKQ